jgi:hypothetical protein
MRSSDLVVRCPCAAAPILSILRVDDRGNRFVHVKIYKQKRIYGEFIIEYGLVRMRCRSCARWFSLEIKKDVHRFRPEDLPHYMADRDVS